MPPPAPAAPATPKPRLRRRTRIAFSVLTAALLLPLLAYAALRLAVALVPFDPDSLVAAAARDGSTVMLDRRGQPLRAYLAHDDRWRIPVALADVAPSAVAATLAAEDRRFWSHGGVDWLAAARALAGNVLHRRTVSGASTITMQLAGFADRDLNLPGPRRTWRRKLSQAFRAMQIERALPKARILELYLTHAPYGGNVCGIEAASQRYLRKSARDLTVSESALLAGIPQAPSRLRPDRHPAAAQARRREVLRRLRDNGQLSSPEHDRLAALTPSVAVHDAPVRAPHFCDLVRARAPRDPVVRTTLDPDLQAEAESRLRARLAALAGRGVGNGAVVVLDVATGEVRALVGSADYAAADDAGQVNGAAAPRSPGSALKPLFYALAFDRGDLLPATVLADVPTGFAGYHPENFDRAYQGPVAAERALAWSLNLPAVEVVQAVGVEPTVALLRRAGLGDALRGPASSYGLSLAVGTCSVRLLDLSAAYAALARGGDWLPWQVLAPDPGAPPAGPARRLASPAACYLATRALADPALRPPESIDPAVAGLRGVAWKTGTSNGFRDSWTLAYDARHVVGVWLGNMDGTPTRAVSGAEGAAPLALGIIQWLRRATPQPSWPLPPPDLATATVCALTGRPPGPDCPTTRTVAAPAAARRPTPCAVHRRLPVDAATGSLLCSRCLAGHPRADAVFAAWPTPVAAWFARQGATPPADAPPPHLASCPTRSPYSPPRITSPAPGDRFVLAAGVPAELQRLALQATAAPAGGKLYWFIDGAYAAEAQAGGPPAFADLTPGRRTARLVDEFGRSDAVTFTVEEDAPGP